MDEYGHGPFINTPTFSFPEDNSMRSFLKICVLTLTFVSVSEICRASIVNFTGNPATGDVFDIKMRNRENFINFATGPGGSVVTTDVAAGTQFQYGVGVITTIDNLTKINSAYDQAIDSGELTFTIQNYDLRSIIATGATSADLYFTGGLINLYYDTTKDNPTTSSANNAVTQGTNAAPDASGFFTDGQLNLILGGLSGIQLTNIAGTTFDETTATLKASVNLSGIGLTGNAQGLLSVLGGPLGGAFDSNGFTNGADFTLQSTLQPRQIQTSDPTLYPVISNDPLLTNFVAPEPMSIMVWTGMVVAACGVALNRKRTLNRAS